MSLNGLIYGLRLPRFTNACASASIPQVLALAQTLSHNTIVQSRKADDLNGVEAIREAGYPSMTVNLQISDRVARQLESFGPGVAESTDVKLAKLLEAELRRQLARYDMTDRQLSRKYDMSFAEFEHRQMTKDKGYSWEVESDAIAWETAIDGKATVKRQLSELLHGDD